MYHSVIDESEDRFTTTCSEFKKQIFWLYDNGFEVISLSSLVEAIKDGRYNELQKKVVLTFDDGCKDFTSNVLPVLKKFGATATVYIVTGMLGKKVTWNRFAKNISLMNEKEIYSIKKEGISIGSHTVTHENLPSLNPRALFRQLKESYDVLTYFNESFPSISYPWGRYSEDVIHEVKRCGYQCALGVGEKMRLSAVNIYKLPRITITREMKIADYESALTRSNLERELRRLYGSILNRKNLLKK